MTASPDLQPLRASDDLIPGVGTPAQKTLVSRRSISTSIASFGGAQFTIAAASVIRLPLLAHVLGQGRFGLNFVVGNLAPFLLAIAGGVRIASRALVAQQRGAAAQRTIPPTIAQMQRLALRAALGLATVGILLTYVLPLHAWLGVGTLVSPAEFNASIAVTIALCAGSCLGAVGWGKLEAEGRVPLLNGFIAGTAVFGLLVTVGLALVTKSFFVYAIVNSGTSALPWYLPLLYIAFRPRRRGTAAATAPGVAERATALGTAQAAAPLASRALDPFVVSARISPQAAATYGVAQRMSVVTTIVPAGVEPLISAHYAHRRGSRRPARFGEMMMTAAIYAAIGALCGAVLVVLGPAVARFLGGGHGADRQLFIAFFVLGITSSAQLAFSFGATGPRSMYAALWIDGSCALANAVLSFVLVGPLGLEGPVVASIIGSSVAVAIWIVVLLARRDLLSDVHDIRVPDAGGRA